MIAKKKWLVKYFSVDIFTSSILLVKIHGNRYN